MTPQSHLTIYSKGSECSLKEMFTHHSVQRMQSQRDVYTPLCAASAESQRDAYTPVCAAAPLTVSQAWEPHKHPSTEDWISKMWYREMMGCFLQNAVYTRSGMFASLKGR